MPLLPQLAELDRAECEFESIKYRFELEELPNDMKMLAMLAGELTISAKYIVFLNLCNSASVAD